MANSSGCCTFWRLNKRVDQQQQQQQQQQFEESKQISCQGETSDSPAEQVAQQRQILETHGKHCNVMVSSGPDYVTEVKFSINGKQYTLRTGEVSAETSLNSYLRDVANLTGTKFMCNEGGCGACVVAATAEHPVTKQRTTFAVNSCLTPVLACDGWEVTTVEGLGDRRSGYHRVQAALAHFNGTQCGFCSPGMVMNMYSLLEGDKAPSMAEVENAFGGNLCRCTGYRPILDAFKSLSVDASPQLKAACADIEDIYKLCPKTGSPCAGLCSKAVENGDRIAHPTAAPVRVTLSGTKSWYKARTLDEIFAAFLEIGDASYRLVAGNTGEGVYRSSGISAYIDVRDVPELRATTRGATLSLGGNVTLSEAMRAFKEAAAAAPGLAYLATLEQHLDKIANVPVRNVGTLAGNLAMKKAHPEFPSDIFTTFEAVGATLTILESGGRRSSVGLMEFLQQDMHKKLILSIEFPALTDKHRLRTFKITPRAQNAHAYVNAAFLVKFENTNDWTVTDQPRIVFGGINPQFVHASNLETFLTGKRLLESATITAGLAELERQLIPDSFLPDASPNFRKKLAMALFYKFLLGLDPSKINSAQHSGASDLVRPLSSGIQEYDTDTSMFPVNQPIPKIEALAQCSGEAEYVNDIPASGELHGAFVLTTLARGTLSKIDPTEALGMPGVVDFFRNTDLAGPNNFTPSEFGFTEAEEIFCSGSVKYAGQVVGMIVAETRAQALKAAQRVVLEYTDTAPPMLTITDVMRTAADRIRSEPRQEQETAEHIPNDDPVPAHVIKGEFEIAKQYHLTMETQCCLIVPTEDGYDVYAATQYMDHVQAVVVRELQVPASKVRVVVRRVGGAYGQKITRPPQLAAACAVAVKRLNKPVRLVMTMSDNMEAIGKRYGLRNNYEVGVDNTGKIESLKATVYQDCGFSYNDSPLGECLRFYQNCYDSSKFKLQGQKVITDTASNTWCRAPGTTEGVAFIEEVMERIAATLGLDPLAVRLANMAPGDNPLPDMINELKTKADYATRMEAVQQFNATNRWKKRGMALVPMQYRFGIWGNYGSLVSIYQIDGSVAITHGGIEMGQGMNTKVAQVAAHVLGVPLDKVSVQPTTSLTAANAMVTGGSLGSEAVSYATLMACQELLRRLEPVKASLPADTPWLQIVKTAHRQNIDLVATYMFSKKDNVKPYNIWGATAAEVEVDILTGEKQVLRVDLLEDVGQSLSPMVDVGQIEGAFVMGMGYWLSEELVHDPTTGRLLNTRTWNYKPPGAKDIPADFRVYFRRNAPNPVGVLQSKATGEPPLNMSIVVLFAVRQALDSARRDAGAPAEYFQTKPPATTEHVFMDALTDPTRHFNPSAVTKNSKI